jgi:toxin ParE1/3/4
VPRGPNTVCEAPLYPSALADLNSVLDDFAAHSPQGARSVHARIQAIIDLLLRYHGIGTRTDSLAIRRKTALPYPYLIFHEATETEIIILRQTSWAFHQPGEIRPLLDAERTDVAHRCR